MSKVGDKVRITKYVFGASRGDLLGFIESIDGGYHYVKVVNDKNYDVIECYESEFKTLTPSDPDWRLIRKDQIQKAIAIKEAEWLEREKAAQLMDELNIPHTTHDIGITDLYRILSNPKKRQALISKLKLKAFW